MHKQIEENDKRTFRDFLEAELEDRKRRKSSYSLRAFARWLQISPSMLSQILSGEKKITLSAALKLADRLPLSDAERRIFLNSVEGRDLGSFESNLNSYFTDIIPEEFRPVSDPIHYDILALGEVAEGRWDADWIAKRLRVSREKASDAMQRLVHLKMVDLQGETFKVAATPLRVKSPIPEAAIQSYHRECLLKAIASLAADPINLREFNTLTMAVDSSKLPAVRDLTNRYLQNVHALLDDANAKDRIYHISVQIFPGCTGSSEG